MTVVFEAAEACVDAIIARVGRDIRIAIPIGIGKPNLLINALYRRAVADPKLSLKIFTGLSLLRPAFKSDLERRFVAPLLDRLFATWPALDYAEAMRRNALPPNVEVREFFLQAGAWLSNPTAQQSYASLNYAHVAGHLARLGTNVMAQLVAPPPPGADPDSLSLSSNTDVTLDLAGYVAEARKAGRPIVTIGEVNEHLPFMRGEAIVNRSQMDLLFEPKRPHYQLFAPPKEPVSLAEYAMALHAATLVRDGGTLQIGIGAFADALTHALILRHQQNDAFRRLIQALGEPPHPDAELGPFTIGLYGCSEMLVDGFLALRRAGILKRRVMAGGVTGQMREAILHAGFFIGSPAFYRELREMAPDDLDLIQMTGISFTNTLRGDATAKMAQRRDARFINTAMIATLNGAVSSDALEDGRVVSGIGGQGDFVAMAHEIPGARSIIAVRAARTVDRGRRVSNILPRYANTSIPRQLRDIIVTEYGLADLKGRSDGEVAAAMLGVAESTFHDGLIKALRASGKLPSRFSMPASARDNTPARIAQALQPARDQGLLPIFPLGTDMTAVEQALIPVLGRLKTAPIRDILRFLASGISPGTRPPDAQAALDRLSLAAPSGIKERLMRALVLGAMAG